MSWAIGYDTNWQRDIGYGVPSICDHPQCKAEIDRGLSYVCGGQPFGGDRGCGLFFCGAHLAGLQCSRCRNGKPPFSPKQDTAEWMRHKLTHESWETWRRTNPDATEELRRTVGHTEQAGVIAVSDARSEEPR